MERLDGSYRNVSSYTFREIIDDHGAAAAPPVKDEVNN
jgi:hypothetical protein